jgi:chloride channel protein, CIC family
LASGGEGGTFAPALKVGALFGFCFGSALAFVVPETSVGLYAIVGAAAVIAGAFAAPLTGGILLFEISGNYSLLLPLLFTSVFSTYIIRRLKVATFNPIQEDESVNN